MKYHRLGRTSLEVSTLGFGASPLGNVFGNTSLADDERAVATAIDLGINFFDVSPYYGLTLAEQRLGTAFANRRNQVILATKCGRYGLSKFDFSAKGIRSGFEASLARLKTDHVDLLQVHDVEFASTEQVIQETIPAMRELQMEGKTRFIGITGYPVKLLTRIAREVEVDTVLSYCRYNLMNTDMDDVLTPFTCEQNIGLINASPLLMGILTNRGAPEWHLASNEIKEAAKRATEVAVKHGIDISTLALQFSLAHPSVASTLIGMATAEEVKTNVLSAENALDLSLVSEVKKAIGEGFASTWPSGLPEHWD
ncbi:MULTISPECIES: aldo/keto reductase [Acidobacteriaceae]|uniref:aldo/keto reductase n=1 Tax=Acidobacteriaceae TaxID=204434 RepID=UPI00131A7641|nr:MULTISPECIES: aldo/keto reductase [Acidobacteriaceae]MDW5267698.1 aldo/keto reductase [Edaphobacter sp.]